MRSAGARLTAVLPFDEKLIGNPMLPAIHGGVTTTLFDTPLPGEWPVDRRRVIAAQITYQIFAHACGIAGN